MDSKAARQTIDNLFASGRPSFVRRYGRTLGFSLALGMAGLVGCGDDGSKGDKKDAKPAQYDGPVVDVAPTPDLPIGSDARDAAVDSADAPLPSDAKPSLDGPAVVLDGRQRDVPQVDGSPADRAPGVDRNNDRAPGVDRGPGVDLPPRIDTRRADGPELDGGTPDIATTVDVAEENG